MIIIQYRYDSDEDWTQWGDPVEELDSAERLAEMLRDVLGAQVRFVYGGSPE